MLTTTRYLAAALVLLAGLAGVAFTADQTILGKTFLLKNPGAPTQRKVQASAKEKGSPNTIVGNPTLAGMNGGGILEIFVDGASSSNQAFVLNQGTAPTGKPYWTATSTGFKYKDGTGSQGPVKSVQIRRSSSGAFGIKAVVMGKLGPVVVVPPNPGTEACVSLKLGVAPAAGDRYHVKYAPPATITNKGSTLFKVKKPLLEGLCPSAGPTPTTTTTMVVPTTTSTTTITFVSTTTSSTTTTTLYGSPSRAFLSPAADLLD